MVYVTVYSKCKSNRRIKMMKNDFFISPTIDVKRKDEQNDEFTQESIVEMKDECENDPNRRCVDLIVLGISYRSLEADVKKCFEAFGELIFCEVKTNVFVFFSMKNFSIFIFSQIKRDANGQSRGFGFIRFKNYESQLAVINKRHFIDGRHVDVKIPDSKVKKNENFPLEIVRYF